MALSRKPAVCCEDEALSDSLAAILGRLRGAYGRYRGGVEDDLHREADGFSERLDGHVRHAEESLFPALLESGTRSGGDVEEFQKDHCLLALYARELVTQIRDKDRERAYLVARTFLALLLDHVHREARRARPD